MPPAYLWPTDPSSASDMDFSTPEMTYVAMIPNHMLNLNPSASTWSSPAMSVYSDFSFQGDGPTPPPSPPGSTYPAMPYAVCQVDETPIVEQKRKTQKRPARLSQYHTTTASSPFVDVEEMPSPSDPTSPTSTDGTSHKTTKTPAQKMRRLLQNRVSQRNFRQRQASRKVKLEEQVEVLVRRNKDYENLLARYETVLAQSPEGLAVMSTRESATGPADDEKMLGQIIPQVEGLNPYTDMGVF